MSIPVNNLELIKIGNTEYVNSSTINRGLVRLFSNDQYLDARASKFSINSADTTYDYAENKIKAGVDISITTEDTVGGKILRISSTAIGGGTTVSGAITQNPPVTDENVVVYDGSTGNYIKDSSIRKSYLVTLKNNATNWNETASVVGSLSATWNSANTLNSNTGIVFDSDDMDYLTMNFGSGTISTYKNRFNIDTLQSNVDFVTLTHKAPISVSMGEASTVIDLTQPAMGGGYTLYCGGIANWSKPSSTYVVNFGQGADNGICTGGDTIFNPTKVRLRAFSKTPKYTASFAVTTAGNPTYSSGTGGIPAVSLTSFPVFAYLDINGNNGPTSYRIPMMGCSNPYGIGFSKLSQTGFTVHPGYTYLGYLTDSNGSSFNPQSATCTVKLYDQSSMPTDYDSGWTAIAANYILTFNHKLNKIPSLISVFVADTNDDNPNFCLVVMGHQNGNGWYTHINSIDKQNISVCSGASGISYFWNQSQHKHISYGYVRVFAWL